MNPDRPPNIEIERVAETGSTNADLLARVRDAGASGVPRVLVAERQTEGRGRHGRRWYSTPGASLTFSLAWPLARADLSGLSLAIGVALAEALDPRPAGGLRVALKWPNDLWLVGSGEPGRKLGGVLIETAPAGAGRCAVIGVGLNVVEQAVPEASSGVAWLREIDAAAAPTRLLERLVPALAEALQTFERDGFAAFAARFAARDLLEGRAVRCGGATGPVLEGIAAGVSPSGELLVGTERGIERVGSGEVSLGATAPASPLPGRTTAGASC
ncbi:MAG: biotin--[acetyl-CoA-carboxylase] ligase [Polyangia bacterium]